MTQVDSTPRNRPAVGLAPKGEGPEGGCWPKLGEGAAWKGAGALPDAPKGPGALPEAPKANPALAAGAEPNVVTPVPNIV